MSAVKAVPTNMQLDVAVLRVATLGHSLMASAHRRLEEKKDAGHCLTEFMQLIALEAALLDSVLELITFGEVRAVFAPQYRQLSKLAGTPDELKVQA